MSGIAGRQNAIRRRKESDDVFIQPDDSISSTQLATPKGEEFVQPYKRSNSNPALTKRIHPVSRLKKRRSAVTFPSTYKSLTSPPQSPKSGGSDSVASVLKSTLTCSLALSPSNSFHQNSPNDDWPSYVKCSIQRDKPGKRISRNEMLVRKSLQKAIQRAGFNMIELGSLLTENEAVIAQKKSRNLTEVDWTESALPDDHIWAPTSSTGDLCYVGEGLCQKVGPRKKCSACHIVIHENCFPQLDLIGFRCKTTFRDSASRMMKEVLFTYHHWVHRRKQEGKCSHCGKGFEKLFGFRQPTKIVAISCSWCKKAYHNKVSCFQIENINEPCTLGSFCKSIVSPTWIIKSLNKRKLSNKRSKKKKTSSGYSKKRPKENQNRTFIIRPLSQQAAFVTPLLVFINPKSGGNQGYKLLKTFQWFMNPRQVWDLSKGEPKDILELYRKVPNLRILACGGDGTVGWILSALDKLSLYKPPPVAILPLGTGNDLSRTLNFGPDFQLLAKDLQIYLAQNLKTPKLSAYQANKGYTDEPPQKIIQGVEEALEVKLDRWKLYIEKNDEATPSSVPLEEKEMSLSGEYQQSAGVDQTPLDIVNNYFSIGSDAQVNLHFHESREAHPGKFNSRIGNKMFYARASVLEYVTRQSKDLSKNITVICDKEDITSKIRELKPVCILFLNIPRYSSGTSPWGHPTGSEFKMQSHHDKLIEVIAFSFNQLGMLFVGGHGERLCQCRTAYIRTWKTFPVQIDGEPCRLNPSNIRLKFFKQSNMLYKSKRCTSIPSEPSQQIKIRISKLSVHNFNRYNGGKEKNLHSCSTPILVTAVMNHATLVTVRCCLAFIQDVDKSNYQSENWTFLDSSVPGKLYKVDRNQENILTVEQIIGNDKEIFILNHTEYSKQNEQSTMQQHQQRTSSDSALMTSLSDKKTSDTKHSALDSLESKQGYDLMCLDGENHSEDNVTRRALDVVFEQPENDNQENAVAENNQHSTNYSSEEPNVFPTSCDENSTTQRSSLKEDSSIASDISVNRFLSDAENEQKALSQASCISEINDTDIHNDGIVSRTVNEQ